MNKTNYSMQKILHTKVSIFKKTLLYYFGTAFNVCVVTESGICRAGGTRRGGASCGSLACN